MVCAGARGLIDARLLAHHALQWMARFTRSYLPPAPDDSHTALDWSAHAKAFLSVPGAKGGFGLDVAGLTLFAFGPGGRCGGTLNLDKKTEEEVGREFKNLLTDAGYDAEALKGALPYEIPGHAVASGGAYDAVSAREGLAALAEMFDEAHGLLLDVKTRDANASPVRTWPHHFDMATLMTLPGKSEASVNAGFSPGDDHYAEPYYYISPYPYPHSSKLPPNPAYHWHTDHFTAAIMPASKWPSEGQGRKAFLAQGLADALAACKMLLA
ncbi:MAG TPA: hypothetical protein VD713_04645 [Sphingomonadales bacterium]|nr:hypothetical protein [Sphingomonadales bacterium]